MPFSQQNGLRYFQFDSLNVRHAVFSRHGGVSPSPWSSLNVGGSVGDEKENVRTNRLRSFSAMGCKPESMFDVWLVHSADVIYADSPSPEGEDVQKADIVLTNNPELTLYMRFADCVPILVHDPIRGVIGISHAGWMGTLKDVAGVTINSMHKKYGSNPSDIVACIGPSIGPDHYEVRQDVIRQAKQVFGREADLVLVPHNESIHFDLWKANQLLLQRTGVEQIEVAGICTACHTGDWFSHRAEKGKTGRFGALISLAAPYSL
jgi:hypothetical protein